MDCFDDNTAVEFLEGALAASRAEAVEVHMARCSTCRALIAELARTRPAPAAAEAHTEPSPETLADAPLARGADVGRYRILDRIGAGGMGVVYAAYDPKLDRKVALKFLHHRADTNVGDDDARARLVREAQAIARLSHPNAVGVYDVGTYGARVYIAMEYVDGVTLGEWLRWKQRPWREAVELFESAGRALVAAHDAGIVHRDFKPDNVIVAGDGRARVMDFGLARAAADAVIPEALVADAAASALGTALTQTGAILGTPRYMAPEQLSGNVADARSDQFSFCVAVYEALFGTHPLRSGTAAKLARGASLDSELLPTPDGVQVPAWLRNIVVRGLAPSPDDRYPHLRDLLADVRAQLDPRPARPHWAIAAALVGVAAAGLFAYARAAETAEREQLRRASERQARDARDEVARLEGESVHLERRLADETRARDKRIRALERELAARDARLAQLVPPDDDRQIRARPVESAPPFAEALDRRVVRKRLARHRNAVLRCYRDGLRRNPTLGGWITAEFVIDPSGAVVWVRLKGVRDLSVSDCMRAALHGVRFPRSEVATHAFYPLFFETQRSLDVRPGETAQDDGAVVADPLGVLCDPADPLCGVD